MFWTRLASGVVLVLIALVTLIAGGPLLAAVLGLISLAAYLELARAVGIQKEKRWNGLTVTGLAGVAVYYGTLYFCKDLPPEFPVEILIMTGVFIALLFVYVVRFPRYRSEQVFASFFSFVYAPVMFSFIYQTRQLSYGKYIVWLILISSWGCDTCAYVVGMLIGKKKIFPVLSPKKSLEGCIGGVVGAALIGFLYGYFVIESAVPEQSVRWAVAAICGAGAIVSQMGDLAASAIKRNHDIKDYGKIIPGHGGIMDRFDSVIVTAPLIYFLAILLIGN